MKRNTSCWLLGLALTVASVGAAAQEEPVAIEALLSVPALAPFDPGDFSPDGRMFAYTVIDPVRKRSEAVKSGVGWEAIAADVWITELRTGESRNLTGGSGNNWAPKWSPDGAHLAFVSDRGGEGRFGPARLWVWERSTNALRRVGDFDVVGSNRGLDWLSDGRSLLVPVLPAGMTSAQLAAVVSGPAAGESTSASGVTARVYRFDPRDGAAPQTPQHNLERSRRGLAVVDVQTGDARWITENARMPSYTHTLSPNRTVVVYPNVIGTERPGSQQYLMDLVAHDLRTGETRIVAPKVRGSLWDWSPTWSPRGDALAYRTVGVLANDDVFVVPMTGGPPRRVAGEGGPSYDAPTPDKPVWDPAGRHVYFTRGGVVWRAAVDGSGATAFASDPERDVELLATPAGQLWSPDGGRTAIVRIFHRPSKRQGFARLDLASGRVSPAIEQDKRHGGYSVWPVLSPDRRNLAFVAEDAASPAEWWVVSGDLSTPRQVSRVAPRQFSGRTWGKVRVIEWRHLDGDTLRGALLYPAGYEEGRRYPLIVTVYGGSALSDSRNRFGLAETSTPVDNAQIFATRGYAVLLADSKLRLGTPMADLLKSVLPGVDRAIEVGVADPNRVGVMGHSYGGYSTLALIAQSTRFKAAVMSAGQGANLISAYGQLSRDGTTYYLPWAETGQGRMGGTPWEHRARYIENSPIFYLDRVRTPLLIVNGGEDNAYLAAEVFVGLRRLGQPVSYAVYEGEDHWPGTWSYANQVDVVNRTIAWFDRYLKDDARKVSAGIR